MWFQSFGTIFDESQSLGFANSDESQILWTFLQQRLIKVLAWLASHMRTILGLHHTFQGRKDYRMSQKNVCLGGYVLATGRALDFTIHQP